MEITPIVSKQKYGLVAEEITRLIKENVFKEGTQLPTEAELSTMFNVGRSSVREAIKGLQLANILTATAGKGTLVSGNALIAIANIDLGEVLMDKNMLAELVEIRFILEPQAAEMAAKRRTDEDILSMQNAIEEMEGVTDKLKLLRLGHRFHSALIGACKNRAIIQFHDSISLQLLKMREKDFLTSEVYIRDLDKHREILDAIIKKDGDLAKRLMREHLLTDYADYL